MRGRRSVQGFGLPAAHRGCQGGPVRGGGGAVPIEASDRGRDGAADGLAIAGLVLALCLVLLARYGIVTPPDTGSFVDSADALMRPGGLSGDATLREDAIPRAFYRPPLYPLLIAAARGISGTAWPWLLVALQLALATLATVAFHRGLLALCRVRWLAALGALAQATTFALATHVAILADSLYASLLCLAAAVLLLRGMGGGLGAGGALLVGTLLGAGTLLREVGAYTGLLWLPLVAVAALPRGRRAASVAILAALLPMACVVCGMLAWNVARTGEAFLTTVGQVVYFQALLPLAGRGLMVFAADPVLVAAASEAMQAMTLPEVDRLNRLLFSEYGLNAIQISRLAQRAWRLAWQDHPLPMLLATLERIKGHHALTLFLPLENAAHVGLWAEGVPPLLARFDRLLRAALGGRELGLVPLALAALACRAVAAALFACYLLVPWRAWCARGEQAARLALATWPVWPATLLLHALVHLEIRYFAPVLPLAIAGAVWVAAVTRVPGMPRSAAPGT